MKMKKKKKREMAFRSNIVNQKACQIQWVYEFGNGCICCSAKGEVGKALHSLLEKRSEIDHVIIETTGMSGATGNLIDQDLQNDFFLSGVITVVDAKNISLRLDPLLKNNNQTQGSEGTAEQSQQERVDYAEIYKESEHKNEAFEQICIADVILLNKIDLVTQQELENCEQMLRKLNPEAEIIKTAYSSVTKIAPLLEARSSFDSSQKASSSNLELFASKLHDPSITRAVITEPGSVKLPEFEEWLRNYLAANPVNIFRTKGIISVSGSNHKYILQGVHETFSIIEAQSEWQPNEERSLLLVFIGKIHYQQIMNDVKQHVNK